jgi:hypothetical protein
VSDSRGQTMGMRRCRKAEQPLRGSCHGPAWLYSVDAVGVRSGDGLTFVYFGAWSQSVVGAVRVPFLPTHLACLFCAIGASVA